jgi:hypothetical protein
MSGHDLAEPIRVHSPGGWTPPPGTRPGWNWLPEGGGGPRPDRMPMWLRIAHVVPFLDRLAYEWMWSRGGWDVAPAGGIISAGMIISDPPPGSIAELRKR